LLHESHVKERETEREKEQKKKNETRERERHTHAHTHTHTYTHIHTHTHTLTARTRGMIAGLFTVNTRGITFPANDAVRPAYIYTHTHTHTHIHTYAHAYINTRIHIHTITRAYKKSHTYLLLYRLIPRSRFPVLSEMLSTLICFRVGPSNGYQSCPSSSCRLTDAQFWYKCAITI